MALPKKGRKRLSALLCGFSAASCIVLMSVVLVAYGTPYNPVWWWVMGAVLCVAAVAPLALVPAIEWVIEGYRDPPAK